MKKASTTHGISRGIRIAMLERGLAQLLSQVTAVQARVGTLEMAWKAEHATLVTQPGTPAEPAAPVINGGKDAD